MAVEAGTIVAESENDTSANKQAEVAVPANSVAETPVPANAQSANDAPGAVVPAASSSAAEANESASVVSGNLDLLSGVELPVTLCFGRRRLRLREVLDLNAGSVVELDRLVEEPVELLLDERVIARGEVVVVDGNYGLRVLDVVRTNGGTNA